MILNAFFALGVLGKNKIVPCVWYLESGASNLMMFSLANLNHITKYNGNLQVQTANDENLPIPVIGDVSNPIHLKHVFPSPHFTTNLLSMGQLVENNCDVLFSSSGSLMLN